MALVDYETDVEDEQNNGAPRSYLLTAGPAKDEEIAQDHPMFLKGDIWKKTPGEVNIPEMVIGGVKRRVISMEEAIERGFLCKKKLESWQKQNLYDVRDIPRTAHNDVLDSPRIVQVHDIKKKHNDNFIKYMEVSPKAKTIGIKRQSPPAELLPPPEQYATHSYTQLPQQKQEMIHVCKECNVPCSGLMNLETHYLGKKHKARVEELRNGQHGLDSKNAPLKCILCNIPCMNERNLKEHLAGKKHAACLQVFNAATKGSRAEGVNL